MDEEVCETSLIVEHQLTMRHPTYEKVYSYQGQLYKYDVTDPENATPIPPEEVIIADGWEEERLVIVANRSLPGPPITVYEGQRLVVHVINRLFSDTVSIHWHGQPQQGTPWMDGVAFVTQCPILPGQTFTYDFLARPKGTYWYHSHVGTQRTKGLYGALVVRDRNNVMAEHNLLVQGWNHHWSADMDQLKYQMGGIYENRIKRSNSFLLDGDMFSAVLLTSVVINGRGRYYSNWTTEEHNGTPLSVFRVKQGRMYRFRVINADILYPFRVSVDSHSISVVSTDGYDIQPVTVESFIIHSGERFDFVLTADQPVGNYWIRAQSLEIEKDRLLHRADAILRYDNAQEIEPVSSPNICSADSRCLVINCPFLYYPEDAFIDCLAVDKLTALADNDPAPVASDGQLKEYFLNFAFPGVNGFSAASVNGRNLKLPPVSALTQPSEIESTCDRVDCGEEKECECTHSISLNFGDVVQLVLVNMGKATGGFHPIHLHGYSFYVLKSGFGNYNSTTGRYLGPKAEEINCRGFGDHTTSFCNSATWRDQSWGGGNIPNVNLLNPPRKDTLFVPAGGYAVIRIKADNPGLWILHCHMQVHNVDGMAVLLNTSFDRIPKTPINFPVCRNFPPSGRGDTVPSTTPTATTLETNACPRSSENVDTWYTIKTFWVTVAVLVVIILLMTAYIQHLRKQVKDSEPAKECQIQQIQTVEKW
ncbi:laccase-like [Pecten maximus]|uniref:laccase-like n=1 Tax=Pecten maximus TaxID=6579 RepID=UPI0014584C53|nr:laccase-like [Pecten maximus]